MKHFGIILVCIAIAGLIANAMQPTLHAHLPSDFSRTNFILNTILKEKPQAELMVFGNSIAMSGINTKLIKDEFQLDSEAYNFASNGQYFSESLLYYPLISNDCKLVLQMVRSIELEQNLQKLDSSILRNFHFGNYNLNENIEKELDIDIGLEYLQDASQMKLNYDHRGVLVNALNNSIRSTLRKDLNLEKLKEELYFPNVYTSKISEEKLKKMIQLHNPNPPKKSFDPSDEILELISKIQSYFAAKGIRYALVVFPYNPVLDNYTADYISSLNQFVDQSELPIISLANTLSPKDFVDHCHLSKEGGGKLTEILINKLKNSGYEL